MAQRLPYVYLVRHGDTAWTITRQHTGRTDLPLTESGIEHARELGERLNMVKPAKVFTSPLQRASRTCGLAGFGDRCILDPDLMEWDYGQYEGRKTAEILAERPGWDLFRDGAPGGESPETVAARADRVIAKCRSAGGDVLLFSSAHIMRMIAARWIGLPPWGGRCFVLSPASVSVLAYEHDEREPVIRLWNDEGTPPR